MPNRIPSLRIACITVLALLTLWYLWSPSTMQIANPASEYCIQQGGTLEIVKDKDGNEVGMCKLPDGTVVEEWDFFRSQQQPPKVGLANPASVYCIQQGGTLEIVKDKDGNETGMCRFPDGTVREEWDFFRSSQDQDEANSAQL
ncbi:putative hemolysin [Moesziomyces aphidis]|uniref:Hemolysin n=1 Tax=Moesziomyces aphidis TaxID=84754 RepID=W3VSN3_MOEAP|nr:putative hemolysin [Moesziomyces aphidis]